MNMNLVKDIASILGLFISFITVFGIIIKPIRKKIVGFIKKSSEQDETTKAVRDLSELLNEHIKNDKNYREEMSRMINNASNDATVNKSFLVLYARNLVRSMFYKYLPEKKLPLYERKTLIAIEDLYIVKLHENSDTKLLIDTMKTWDTDFTKSCEDGAPSSALTNEQD